jgi:hypothetical protein
MLAELAPGAEAWLLDALGDRSPLVLHAIVRGLARRGGARGRAARSHVVGAAQRSTRPAEAGQARGEASEDGEAGDAGRCSPVHRGVAAEFAAFEDARLDPFWRVRHAVVKVRGPAPRRCGRPHAWSRRLPRSSGAPSVVRASRSRRW